MTVPRGSGDFTYVVVEELSLAEEKLLIHAISADSHVVIEEDQAAFVAACAGQLFYQWFDLRVQVIVL
jgi:hypothetical protein